MNRKKIVFMGTPVFAVPILEMLIENYNVELVITQPDKKVGRKKVLTPTPVKVLAEKHSIEVLQPEKIATDDYTYKKLLDVQPDIIITAAYGQIVPEKILEIPEHKCINVHGSLLPKLRGGAPIQYSILEGHEKTGVTIMYMVKRLDAGDIISQVEFDILENDNFQTVHDRMSLAGSDLLKETLPKIFSGDITPIEQDESLVTFASNITRDDERIDWSSSAREIFNKVRAFDPVPGAFTHLNNQVFKIWRVEIVENIESSAVVGTIVKQEKDSLYVKCGNNTTIKILEVQISGKKRVDVKNFLSNQNDYTGQVLGVNNE
ncbi:MAG: methionyl-tRNA formyltransferase [Gemella sp.]|nr:methionyl-tRNA formyltransferase [Gemella sp.]